MIKALETDIKHFKSVFKVETPCTVQTRTLTKSVGGSFSGPIHPLPSCVPSGFSSLDPAGPKMKHAKEHTCEICGKVLYKLSDLEDHIRNKHLESSQAENLEKPKCSFCGKILSSKSNLKVHEKKHKRGVLHNCNECDYGTNNKQSLASHVIRKHTTKEEAKKTPNL